jgi:hypothetical protein
MTLSPRDPGHGRSARGSNGPVPIVLAAFVLALLLFAGAIVDGRLPSSSPANRGGFGPLNVGKGLSEIVLSFPSCSAVNVTWNVVNGSAVNFSVVPPSATGNEICRGPGPSNARCAPSGCSVYGGNPICFETGFAGACSFTASQPEYTFGLWWAANHTRNSTVAFTADYT